MNISGAVFRYFPEKNLDAMGYRPIYTDPELWLRIAVNLDGFEYYEYIIFYVDAVLFISHNLRKLMKRIQEYLKLKDENI